jgi:hypothetical protein
MEENNMGLTRTPFKNLPLKLRIIGYILSIYAFVILAIFSYLSYIIYTGKLLTGYLLIASINALVFAICSLVFVLYREYRIKRN